MDDNNHYIIERDIITGKNTFKSGKYICNKEDGCHKEIAKLETSNIKTSNIKINSLVNMCQLKCADNIDCKACYFNKESQECEFCNIDQELLLDNEFNKITTNALRIKANSGFRKKKIRNNNLFMEDDIDPSSCGCGS